jgi:hypothetical protein
MDLERNRLRLARSSTVRGRTRSPSARHIDSNVAGDVDVLLAPDLTAGNMLAKDLECLASAMVAGIVMGARVPIVLPSRSDPPLARLVSAAIAALVHHRWRGDVSAGPGKKSP